MVAPWVKRKRESRAAARDADLAAREAAEKRQLAEQQAALAAAAARVVPQDTELTEAAREVATKVRATTKRKPRARKKKAASEN